MILTSVTPTTTMSFQFYNNLICWQFSEVINGKHMRRRKQIASFPSKIGIFESSSCFSRVCALFLGIYGFIVLSLSAIVFQVRIYGKKSIYQSGIFEPAIGFWKISGFLSFFKYCLSFRKNCLSLSFFPLSFWLDCEKISLS